MKTILVPTDFNEAAENAIKTAVNIAEQKKAKIKLLTMLSFSKLKFRLVESAVYSEKEYEEQLEKDAERELNRWQGWYPNVKIEGIIKKKEKEGLTPAILSEEADLIVMGSEGPNGWTDYFKGTNTQNVVRNADCPVLVLKGNIELKELKRVLFVTDFTKTEFLKEAKKVFNFENSKNHFVLIDTGDLINDTEEIFNTAKGVMEKYKIENFDFEIFKADTVQKGILQYANKLGVDLIVLYTNGRQGLERFVMGSIAEDVVNASEIPVLSILE
jgi:nucleotide-binding universal stress UspA family protein